ncbi:dihydrofolate reductase [Bacteroides sp. 51]|uniref:dihydrofolate reductase n=1 Tax=Bacteroides sp. 51 TaxID=2302938 RepID=UPI0013D8B0F6|nr:dihydrofolate reductase [Bacteroides sp. 51]NDV80468.1 dihydrofolate reductase [Bacteroides sp. 51]
MKISIIVAAAENNVIGGNNQLLWRLPNDMKWFKANTTGNTVIMGRKTYDSMGRALPNRRNIIISRNPDLKLEGCEVVGSLDEALQLVSGENEVFIIGGGEIYKQTWNKANRLYLTRVHTHKEGDTTIPEIRPDHWAEESREDHPTDEKHPYAYSFIIYNKK